MIRGRVIWVAGISLGSRSAARFVAVSCSIVLSLLASVVTAQTRLPPIEGKPVVYQVFTRLFGNVREGTRAWGTLEENGVGKFADINDAALSGIRDLGVTHIWYTGVPHHASVTDYSEWGIPPDDPDVVKGRAGSPYAVRDYYSVDPDLAENPSRRLEEFRQLVDRSHRHGLRVIIDIVPNHVARRYRSLTAPRGVEDLGASDDQTAVYRRDNNFYYVVGEAFDVPDWGNGKRPLGGLAHPLADDAFDENPARWTGNGARSARPSVDDWYETARINYGVRPDGSHDFPALPPRYASLDPSQHQAFWSARSVPDSWHKMRDIALFWLEQGVDGFRYDMAEMVPVEFWSYLNSAIKVRNPEATLIAEVYQPDLYRDYLGRGLMDYLYAKVDLYDKLVAILAGESAPESLTSVRSELADIESGMLTFLENHDELRIASDQFASDPRRARAAMAVTALMLQGPTMIYFGQEVGEKADDAPGFGEPGRTTIFDYWHVPAHQRWMNGGRFDGGAMTGQERSLRDFYGRLLRFASSEPAATGPYLPLQVLNRRRPYYPSGVFAFARQGAESTVVVVANLADSQTQPFQLQLPLAALPDAELSGIGIEDVLGTQAATRLSATADGAELSMQLEAQSAAVLLLARPN
jgi:glycosidase